LFYLSAITRFYRAAGVNRARELGPLAARQGRHLDAADLHVVTERVVDVEAVFVVLARVLEAKSLQLGQHFISIIIGNGISDMVHDRLALRPRLAVSWSRVEITRTADDKRQWHILRGDAVGFLSLLSEWQSDLVILEPNLIEVETFEYQSPACLKLGQV